MRVGFAGTPAFAARALQALHGAGFSLPLVLTRPDRPQGRGMKLAPSAVGQCAAEFGLTLFKPASLKPADAQTKLFEVPLDVLVVAAYGLILPPAVLAWPRHGCLNIHASLLPRWRGAAPIQRAIEAGDRTTGITIMQMDAGLDTGPMLLQEAIPIEPQDTGGSVHDRLAEVGAHCIVVVLQRLAREGRLGATAQPDAGVTYAPKISAADTRIDWTRPAEETARRVRAYLPAPGLQTSIEGVACQIGAATPCGVAGEAQPPGTVTTANAEGIEVACGEGRLRILQLKPAGSRMMSAAAYLAGRRLLPGTRLGPAAVVADGA